MAECTVLHLSRFTAGTGRWVSRGTASTPGCSAHAWWCADTRPLAGVLECGRATIGRAVQPGLNLLAGVVASRQAIQLAGVSEEQVLGSRRTRSVR